MARCSHEYTTPKQGTASSNFLGQIIWEARHIHPKCLWNSGNMDFFLVWEFLSWCLSNCSTLQRAGHRTVSRIGFLGFFRMREGFRRNWHLSLFSFDSKTILILLFRYLFSIFEPAPKTLKSPGSVQLSLAVPWKVIQLPSQQMKQMREWRYTYFWPEKMSILRWRVCPQVFNSVATGGHDAKLVDLSEIGYLRIWWFITNFALFSLWKVACPMFRHTHFMWIFRFEKDCWNWQIGDPFWKRDQTCSQFGSFFGVFNFDQAVESIKKSPLRGAVPIVRVI